MLLVSKNGFCMILNKQELAVLNVFRKNLNKLMSIAEIQKISKKASKAYVFNTLKKLESIGLIERKMVGTSSAFKAKSGSGTIKYFSLLDMEDFDKSNISGKTVQKLAAEFNPLKMPYCLMIFGSYAKGKAGEKSDIDIAILVGGDKERKAFSASAESVALREILPIHIEIITTDEFFGMLLAKEANLGKEIVYNHIIVSGNDIYYQLVDEAYKHGFSC